MKKSVLWLGGLTLALAALLTAGFLLQDRWLAVAELLHPGRPDIQAVAVGGLAELFRKIVIVLVPAGVLCWRSLIPRKGTGFGAYLLWAAVILLIATWLQVGGWGLPYVLLSAAPGLLFAALAGGVICWLRSKVKYK